MLQVLNLYIINMSFTGVRAEAGARWSGICLLLTAHCLRLTTYGLQKISCQERIIVGILGIRRIFGSGLSEELKKMAPLTTCGDECSLRILVQAGIIRRFAGNKVHCETRRPPRTFHITVVLCNFPPTGYTTRCGVSKKV